MRTLGDNPNFLAGWEARQERYVVAVRLRPGVTGQVWRADALLETVPRWQWRMLRWRRGTKGWWRKKFVALRCWRGTSEGQGYAGWLLGERAARGQPEERQYGWSTLPVEATVAELASLAPRRHAIEQCHEEAKGELGWDHYQGRVWPGFHRHAVLVMLAYSFLVWLALHPRRRTRSQGRHGDPFSPSAAASAQDVAGRPS